MFNRQVKFEQKNPNRLGKMSENLGGGGVFLTHTVETVSAVLVGKKTLTNVNDSESQSRRNDSENYRKSVSKCRCRSAVALLDQWISGSVTDCRAADGISNECINLIRFARLHNHVVHDCFQTIHSLNQLYKQTDKKTKLQCCTKSPWSYYHNFVKYWPIMKILSLIRSAINLTKWSLKISHMLNVILRILLSLLNINIYKVGPQATGLVLWELYWSLHCKCSLCQ